jgi:hypothetical protein
LIAEHEAWMQRHDAAMESLGKRIGDMVSAIGAFIAAQGKASPQA